MRAGIIYTLVFLKNNSEILLGLKKRGLGKGKWNGFGGKVEQNETIYEGAIREMKEESNLKVEQLNYIGLIAYDVKSNNTIDYVHIFTTNKYHDILQETDEMKPQWFQISELPFQQMWPDSKHWFPYMLNEKCFFTHVVYDTEHKYESCEIKEYESIDLVLEGIDHFKVQNCVTL